MIDTPCEVRCCICRSWMDWHKRYGREGCCCSKECFREFGLRQARSILGKPSLGDGHTMTLSEVKDAAAIFTAASESLRKEQP